MSSQRDAKDKIFELVREDDLADYVVPGKEDSAAFALPEWSGEYYWYATTR